MAPTAVAPVHDAGMDRDEVPALTGALATVAVLFNLKPLTFNTPCITKEQVPGAVMMGPYKAPEAGEEIIGYEIYYPRDFGGPFACNIAGMNWWDACFDTCCYPCAFGPGGLLLILAGVGSCLPCCFKKYQKMCQRPVYGKKGTDITRLIPHSSLAYVEGVHERKE